MPRVSTEQHHWGSSALARNLCHHLLVPVYAKWICKARRGKKALWFPYELDNPAGGRREQETGRFAWKVAARDPPKTARGRWRASLHIICLSLYMQEMGVGLYMTNTYPGVLELRTCLNCTKKACYNFWDVSKCGHKPHIMYSAHKSY